MGQSEVIKCEKGTIGFFEPVIIEYGDIHWHNPDIDDLLQFGEHEHNCGLWNTTPVFKIVVENENEEFMNVVVVSSMLENFWDQYVDHLGKDNDKQTANDIMRNKAVAIHNTLIEKLFDMLCHGSWKVDGDEFTSTNKGSAIAQFYDYDFIVSHTPDIGVSKDSENEYSWST